MMIYYKSLIYRTVMLFIFIFTLMSCENKKDEKNHIDVKKVEKSFEYANKHMANVENEKIDSYVKRYNWNMIETGSGLRYLIYHNGDGEKAEIGKVARVHYNVSLINGIECYNSKENGAKEFLIGRDEVESGLHEGIQYLHVGDKAKFIIPSYLAFGLIGDMKKIPKKATLIYDIELVALY